MDLTEEHPPHTTIRQENLEQELSVSYVPCQVESGGAFSLQVLEFKTCLLEAVEELQIRRDAEIRFGQQINKLVLEKQELEWQKEALQHQLETMIKQHTEALANFKKQFQGKMILIEEEKGIHQLNTQSKDNAINGLKEDLKALQLSSYSFEKKSSELEQKLALQSRSKDSHLRQLREVENRFGILSRLCAAVKQAHSRLERDVDEAMRMNKKLTSINEKHESTINSFMQELEDTNGKLIKVQVSSMFDPGSSRLTAKEQHADRLQQRLLMETERNRKLKEENASERADKQELMRSLQVAQQLLQCQTSALTRLETELHLLTEQHQALKRDHEATRALGVAAAAVTEDHATSRTLWEKERAVLLESLEREQRDHGSMRATYDRLYREQSGRSSQTSPGPEIAEDGKAHDITTPLCRAVEGRTGPGSLLESSPGSELPRLGSEGGCVPSQTGDPDSVVVSDELAATRAMRGQEGSRYHPSLQPFESRIPNCLVATPVATRNLVGQDSLHGLGDSQTDSLSTEAPRPLTHECDPAPLADVIDNNVCLSDVGLPKNLKSFISGPENRSVYDDADLVGDMLTARERQPSEQEASALQAEGTREHREGPSALQAELTREHREGPSALQAEGTREHREGPSALQAEGTREHREGPSALQAEGTREHREGPSALQAEGTREHREGLNALQAEGTREHREGPSALQAEGTREHREGPSALQAEGTREHREGPSALQAEGTREHREGPSALQAEGTREHREGPSALQAEGTREHREGPCALQAEGTREHREGPSALQAEGTREHREGPSALQAEGTREHREGPSALQAEGTREHREGPSALQGEGTREHREGLSGNREDGCSRPGIHSSGPEDAGERLTEDAVETRDAVLEDGEETDRTKAGQEEEERRDVEAEGLGSLARSPGTEIGRVTSGDKAQRDGELSDALQGIDPPERTEPPLIASRPPAPPPPLEVSGIRAYTSNLTTDSEAPNAGPHHSCDVESGTASDWETSLKESAHPVDVPPEHGNQPTMCCFPLSSTLPDYPLSDSTIYQECSEAQDMVKNNIGNVDDHSKTDREISGRFDEPENEESLTGTRVVETHPPNKENSYVESTSEELSSSERRGNQIPVRSPADVKDETKREASPADLSKVVIVDPLPALPAVPCSALQNEDTKEANFDVNTTAGESEPPRQVRGAEAAPTQEVDDAPAERVLKPADRPNHESTIQAPPKTHGSRDGSVDAHILDHSVHCGNKKFRSSFEWTSFQTKKGSAGLPQFLSSTAINVNQNRVPATAAATASSLPGAPSASRPRSPQKRDQRGDWKAIRQAFRATAAEDAVSPLSLSFQLLPTSAPMESGHGSTTSAAPGPGTGSIAGLDLFPPSSPENQQSSLRAQISRIEQFLSTDRLRLAKRRRTEH
ncbi:uncharacterized protein LOC132464045 isoform X2 [Gadus macrocephalus]|uniref:uncharacterized protein LOC132464045 isoform X2 n=1 Tax=Gadus macrocephalus TaxID=80720 RepID=UPI0028CB3205|nr:uncharacterized protein LOC132464045 isoform X2 [Gadus macrocephalus]